MLLKIVKLENMNLNKDTILLINEIILTFNTDNKTFNLNDHITITLNNCKINATNTTVKYTTYNNLIAKLFLFFNKQSTYLINGSGVNINEIYDK